MTPLNIIWGSAIILLISFHLNSVEGKVEWRKADLTTFESYPTSSSECEEYNGCEWEGQFAFVDGKKSKQWVKDHNIIAIHSKFSKQYKLKTFRIRQGSKEINATVYDECRDSDCGESDPNCCTNNMKKSGFLIDMESFTTKRFGSSQGVVTWTCLDC